MDADAPALPPLAVRGTHAYEARGERVVDRNQWLDVKSAPLQYRHVSDEPVNGPYRILISDQEHYCVVNAAAYTIARAGDLWTCDWHVQRPGAGDAQIGGGIP